MTVEKQETTPHPDPERLWRWRRRFAVAAMAALMFGLPLLVMFATPEAIVAAAAVVNTWQFCMTLVIIAYIANCAAEAFISRGRP